MKHLSMTVLAVALIAAGATACFKDPNSSLRNGPSAIELSLSSITLNTGDSLSVRAVVKDGVGNTYDANDATWSSSVPAVATVRLDSSQAIPFNAFSQAFVVAVAPTGGVTTVTITSRGITDSLRVLVLPTGLAPLMTSVFRGGTAVLDSIVTKNPDNTISRDIFTTGDTIVFRTNAGSLISFDAANSTVSFGATKAYILARSSDSIKAVARTSFHGRPWITKLTWHSGTAAVGDVALDSLPFDVIAVAKPRYGGAVAVSAGVVMTINAAPTGVTFRTASPASAVVINGKPASIITRTATQLVVADTAVADSSGTTGGVVISNVAYTGGGGMTFDSLWSTGSYTIRRIVFPGTITTPASLMDTIKVRAPGTLDAATSNVATGGVNAWVLYRSADSIFAIAKQPGAITVTNVTTGGVTFPSLSPAHAISAPSTPTGEPNEPGNNSRATATLVDLTGTTAASPLNVYGVMSEAADPFDYYTFTIAAPQTVTATISWFGNGGGASTANPDFDVIICGPAPVAACSYGNDLSGNVASGSVQPETFTVALAAGTYFIRTFAYVTAGPVVYKLALNLP